MDAGPGIGTGTGQVNSSLCSLSTLAFGVTSSTYNTYAFADRVYFTPLANVDFGATAYTRLHDRW